jgi:hypothetical protein
MNNLKNLHEYAENLYLKKTITNFIFEFNNKDLFCNFYDFLINELTTRKTFDSLDIKFNNDELKIYEIKYCDTEKFNIKTIAFVNEELLNSSMIPIQHKKNINITIIKKSDNSEKIKYFLCNYKTSFDKYFKQKKLKIKSSIYLLKRLNTSDNVKFSKKNLYKNVEINYDTKNNEIITKTIINIDIDNEKIICYGRMLLPNCVSIITKDGSRINIYKNNKIQIIPKKTNNNIQFFDILYKNLHNYIYLKYNEHVNFVNEQFHCDFNYINENIKLPIFVHNVKNLSFFGRDKINIRSMKTKYQLEKIFKEILTNNVIIGELYNRMINIDPFTAPINQITDMVKLLNI